MVPDQQAAYLARPDLRTAVPRLGEDCLGAPTGDYQQCSWLDELANGVGGAASQCVWPPARYGETYYDFGSGLDWNPL
jgi:hypothetical protein